MKLTTKEEEIIEVPDEGRKEEIESCSQRLIGKFLTCKSYNKRAAFSTLKKAWGLQDEVQIGAVAGKTKRGKKQDGSPNDEAAGVLEHPCRSQ